MPMPPWGDIGWFFKTFLRMLFWPVGLTNITSILITTLLFFLGCLSLFFRNWQSALILTMPFLTTLLASGFEKYPFDGRLLLFVVPMVILLVTEGLKRSYLMLRKDYFSIAIGVWIILGVLLMYKPVEAAFQNLNNSNMEHIKSVMAYLKQNKLDTQPIYVYYGAWPAFQYYAPSYDLEYSNYIVGITSRDRPEKYLQDIDKLAGQGPVWYLFSHNYKSYKINEKEYVLEYLDQLGVKIDEFESSGASVYLYDLSLPEP